MNVSLQELRALSDQLHTIPDDRPAWLKDMPYALESPSHYYRLLWEIVKWHKPTYTLEIGIDKGGSTLTLAAAHRHLVISVDIDRASCLHAQSIATARGLDHLTIVQNDSLKHVELLKETEKQTGVKADLLFLDGYHDFSHAYAEYEQYRPLMNEGAIILFDDIHESREMEEVWARVVDPKTELPKAHWTGFGACKVMQSITCPPLSGIVR